MVLLRFQYGKNDHELPISIPSQSSLISSCEDVEVVSPTDAPFTHFAEFADFASRNVSAECYPEVERLHQVITMERIKGPI